MQITRTRLGRPKREVLNFAEYDLHEAVAKNGLRCGVGLSIPGRFTACTVCSVDHLEVVQPCSSNENNVIS